MFIRKLLVISTLLATSTVALQGYAQDGTRPFRDGAAPNRDDRMLERPTPQRHAPGRLIHNMDSNADSLISQEEFTTQQTENYERQFDNRDLNEDGLLSSSEFGPRHPALDPDIDIAEFRACIAENGGDPDLEEDRFAASDTNTDGSVSKEEFFMHLEQRAYDQFGRIDSNDDGQLTAEELASNMRDRNLQRRASRQCLREAGAPFL
ncbi:MAG: hypothetical protein Q7V56_17220 [Gammaproteobacteria bacterium]|nr:hypothetical protein [Gammaproteobacteria bacterium]